MIKDQKISRRLENKKIGTNLETAGKCRYNVYARYDVFPPRFALRNIESYVSN